jgi:hypothetical protein
MCREEDNPAAAEHDGIRVPEDLPGMVCGLAQVRGARVGFETRPQGLDDLIAEKTVAVGQGEQLHEFRGSTERPTILRRLATPDQNSESS